MDFLFKGKLMDEETEGGLFNFIFDQPLDLPWRMDLGGYEDVFLCKISSLPTGAVPPK